MIYHLKNIISDSECTAIVSEFYANKEHQENIDLKKLASVNSFGYVPQNLNHYLDNFSVLVKNTNPKLGDNLKNVNVYLREYGIGSYLKKHVDRATINVTMSVCLFNNLQKEWPIYVKINDEIKSIDLKRGDAFLLFNSNKYEHWRDELICQQDEKVIQMFLHWFPLKSTQSII